MSVDSAQAGAPRLPPPSPRGKPPGSPALHEFATGPAGALVGSMVPAGGMSPRSPPVGGVAAAGGSVLSCGVVSCAATPSPRLAASLRKSESRVWK